MIDLVARTRESSWPGCTRHQSERRGSRRSRVRAPLDAWFPPGFFSKNKFQLPRYHNDQNDVAVVYGALGDFVDLTKDVIFKLRIVVRLNTCVGV